jgi:hypothetical protein
VVGVKTLLLALALIAPIACVPMNDDVMLATAATVSPAPVAPGLTDGCNETGRTVGRLVGHLYTLPLDTRRLPDFDALTPAGAVCLDRLDVSERSGFPSFPGIRNRYTWFGVALQGAFIVEQPGVYTFRLTSDDGSKLIIDGVQVIDNDGFHQVATREATVQLTSGPHVIDVPYWQGPGPLALVLEVARPAGAFEVFRVDQPLRGVT